MNILFIADVVGNAGVSLLQKRLPELKRELNIDFTVVNAENASAGNGLIKSDADLLFASGADVLTGGNHSFDRRDEEVYASPFILRPLNWNSETGSGSLIYDAIKFKIGVISAVGTVNMGGKSDNPFISVKNEVLKLKKETDLVLVDFHAEATSEKKAMGFWLDGLATAVLGTHIHCQTNDAQILPNGTAFITDAGFTGAYRSVLGVNPLEVINRFAFDEKNKLIQLDLPPYILNGVVITVLNGKVTDIKSINRIYNK
jgi:metallophosphoesterase (TIGR00282 family)